MSPGSAEDVSGFKFPAKIARRNSRGFSRVLPGYSTVFSPGLNFSREPRLQSKRSHLNNRYPQNCIFEKDHHLQKIIHFHKSQPPTGLKKKKKKTAPSPPTKIKCFAFKAPPPTTQPPYFFIWNNSQLLCSGVQEYMYSLFNAEGSLVSVCMHVCVC